MTTYKLLTKPNSTYETIELQYDRRPFWKRMLGLTPTVADYENDRIGINKVTGRRNISSFLVECSNGYLAIGQRLTNVVIDDIKFADILVVEQLSSMIYKCETSYYTNVI